MIYLEIGDVPSIIPINITGSNFTFDDCDPLDNEDYAELMWTSAAELPSIEQ